MFPVCTVDEFSVRVIKILQRLMSHKLRANLSVFDLFLSH